MADSPEEIKKAQNKYLMVLAVLCVFTVVTVAVATVPALDFGGHGFDGVDAVIGLIIATIKASLVAAIFMHLNHEKGLIYFLFGMALVFGVFLMWLTGWAFSDPIEYGEGYKLNEKTGFYDPANPPSEAEKKND